MNGSSQKVINTICYLISLLVFMGAGIYGLFMGSGIFINVLKTADTIDASILTQLWWFCVAIIISSIVLLTTFIFNAIKLEQNNWNIDEIKWYHCLLIPYLEVDSEYVKLVHKWFRR